MTARDLIQVLQQLDPDAEIYTNEGNFFHPVGMPRHEPMIRHADGTMEYASVDKGGRMKFVVQ